MNQKIKKVLVYGIPTAVCGATLLAVAYVGNWVYDHLGVPIMATRTEIAQQGEITNFNQKLEADKKAIEQLEKKNEELDEKNEDLDKKLKDEEEKVGQRDLRISKMFDAKVADPAESRDTRNFRDTLGQDKNHISLGLGGSQLHDARWIEGRYFGSIARLSDDLSALLDVTFKMQDGHYFRGQAGKYNMPFGGSLDASLLIDGSRYTLDKNDRLSAGLSARIDSADFDGFVKRQTNFKLGPRVLIGGQDWQLDGRLSAQYRDSRYQDMTETGPGVGAELLGSVYLGKGFSLLFNGGINFLDSQTKGSGYDVDNDTLEVNGGLALAWNADAVLQLRAYADGLWGKKRYGSKINGTSFPDDEYSLGEFGLGAQIQPLAKVYRLDKERKLFTPLGDLYFDFSTWVTQSPDRKLDFGAAGSVGTKF